MNSAYLCDGYKLDHRRQYPEGTTMVYSNFTPRSNMYANGVDKVVVFGIQYLIMEYFINDFKRNFFDKPIDKGDKVSDPSGLFKVSPQLGYVLGQIPQYAITGGAVRKNGIDKLIHIFDKGLATGVKSYDNVQYGGRTIQERNENDAYYNSYNTK